MQRIILSVIFIFFIGNLFCQTVNLIPVNDSWKFLDNGTDQGIIWQNINFNDASWSAGNAELGYGDGDEATTVSYGTSANDVFITTYFRHSFNVVDPTLYSYLSLELLRDDGAVVYLNGNEIYRSNMPSGNINYQTLANGTVAWPNEDDWYNANISSSFLVAGNNVVAVEIHQDDNTSSDISFNFKLDANTNPINANVIRGPYLQMATDNSMVVKWRTDIATDSKIEFGTTLGNLNQTEINSNFSTEHEVLIQGLNASTKYFYNIGSLGQIQLQSNDFYFKTNPIIGTEDKYRFWVIGDAGMGNNDQRSVRDAFVAENNSQHINGWIMLGDNAYQSGFDSEYQTGVFQNMYETILGNTVLWPAPGNHDYNNNIPFSPDPAYYEIFTLPANGEAGGLASGTEKYYSYNIGNIHFVSLDSYDESRSSTGPMANWLQSDLSANTQPWVIAYWHHPPYTKGSHDSDDNFLDGELIDMRENILPILENFGVDLVLNGHSHSYERSKLIDSHYGYSNTLQSSMILDANSGNYSIECPYQKETETNVAHQGTVYAVVGCSGKLSGTSSGWPHPVMYEATNTTLGSMILEIEGNRLDAKFITNDTTVYDQFTILKNAGGKQVFNLCPNDTIYLKPSWPGNVTWFPGNATDDSLQVIVQLATTFFAYDTWNCVADTFEINILPSPPCVSPLEVSELMKTENWQLFPSITQEGEMISIVSELPFNDEIKFELYNSIGNFIQEEGSIIKMNDRKMQINTNGLAAGIYLVSLTNYDQKINLRFVIQ